MTNSCPTRRSSYLKIALSLASQRANQVDYGLADERFVFRNRFGEEVPVQWCPISIVQGWIERGRDQHRSRFRWRKHEIGSAEILVVEGDFLQQRPAGDNPVPAIAWRKEEWRRLSMKRLHAFERILDKSGRSEEHTSELQSLMRISYA